MTILITMAMFALCMAGLGVGLMLQGRELQGSCGGVVDQHGDDLVSCGVCSKKEADVCPSDDPLVALAQIAHPNPEHHR